MLDVLHFFFEEDVNYSSGEQAEAHGKIRSNMYSTLYGVEYKYASHAINKSGNGFDNSTISEPLDADEPENLPDPFNPREKAVIPFSPATKFDPDAAKPFGDILDNPLG